MKKFWEDYKMLCKQTGEFYKDHWKGVIVLNVVVLGVELAVIKAIEIKNQKEYEEFYAKYCDYEDKAEG